MDKLVELLNEYEVYKGYKRGGWEMTSMGLVYAKDIRDKGAIIILKSKEYGFIERLVKNGKIDLDKVEQEAMGWFYDESPVYGNEILTARLIMILSVSNNPISDLVYYLK